MRANGDPVKTAVKIRWSSLSRGKRIAFSVLALHLLILLALVIHHFTTSQIKPRKPIFVRTAAPRQEIFAATKTPPQKTVLAAAKPTSPKLPLTKKSPPKTTQKKESAKTPPQKTTAPKKAAAPSLFEELAQSLDSLAIPDAATPPSRSSLSIPSAISLAPKASVAALSSDPSDAEELVHFLQSALELPELGEVKVHLILSPSGSLKQVEILETKSRKNSEFLKIKLPELTYPCFNEAGLEITLVFRNQERSP